MGSSLPIDKLLSGDPAAREDAAKQLREVAERSPRQLHGSLDRVVEAFSDDREGVRRYVANAVFEVGTDDPAAVSPVAEPLVDALDDGSTAVRMGVARPLAELAARNPQRLRFAVDRLVPFLTDAKSVRHSVAWTLDSLSPRYPERLYDHVDALTRALLDDYFPVQTHLLRALTAVERTYPGTFDVATDRLRNLLEADVAAVRQAACRAVAVHEPPRTRELLTEVCRSDPHDVVRATARECLTDLARTRSEPATDGDDEAVFAALEPDSWVAVRTGRTTRPFLVGRVSTIVRTESEADTAEMRSRELRREDFDTRDAWLAAPRVEPSGERTAVHLHDPFEGAGINLLDLDDGLGVEHVPPDRQVPSLHRPVELLVVSADRARLLAATPGDTLSFAIEGAQRSIRVTAAGERDGVYRVAGENAERGYHITFRPLGDHPCMAVFEKGRAFPATDIQLTI